MQRSSSPRRMAMRLAAAAFVSWSNLGNICAAQARDANAERALEMIAALRAVAPDPSLGDQANVFGRLVGDWKINYAFFSKDGATTRPTGEFAAGWVMDGRVLQCLYTIDPSAARKQKYIGTSLTYFDAKSNAWRLIYVDPENDAVIRVEGGAVGNDKIVFLSRETDGKTSRWSFNDIRRDSFVYRDEVSGDNGHTWRLREEDHMNRQSGVTAAE